MLGSSGVMETLRTSTTNVDVAQVTACSRTTRTPVVQSYDGIP